MKKYVLLLMFLAGSFTTFADGNEPKKIELTTQERQLVKNNNRFAYSLFGKIREKGHSNSPLEEVGRESFILSPLSITVDLGMLNNGADGITREEIDAVLGSTNVGGADAINAFCRKMLTESGTLDEKTSVAMANNIYVNTAQGCQLKSAFVETAKQYYDATPESRDFGDGVTRDIINQWGSDHTEGMIPEAIKEEEFCEDAISYLLNALYFKGEWTHKFDATKTYRAQFDEGHAEAYLMNQYSDFSYTENMVYQSVILPYGNRAYQMTVYLPRFGRTIDDVLSVLSTKGWNEEEYGTCKVNLLLPKFETLTDIRLEDIMKSLGMPNAFEGGYGFNEFCNQNVYIGMMKQCAKIKLDEEGTEASAVTVIDIRKNGGPGYAEFLANRPFLYTISERSTGAIFFIGQYLGEPLANPRKDISVSEDEKKLVEGNNDFAFNLFRKIRQISSNSTSTGRKNESLPLEDEGGRESLIFSPLSITYALGLLNNGAAGQTQQEINEVLGFGDAGADAINAFCRKMLTEASTLDNTTVAEIANSIFVNSGKNYYLQQGFIEKADQFYDAEPQSLNFFEKEQTMGIINQWANDHTRGMIPEVLNEEIYNEQAVSYLLNALYFKGAWTNKFDVNVTKEESFNGGEPVPMMQQWEKFEYTENDLYQAVHLPYGNEAYRMTIFLPREGKTIDDVLSQLNGRNWNFRKEKYDIDLKLPRIQTSTDLPLVDIMRQLGLTLAFTLAAEFPYFCNTPVYISNMFQKAIIELDEEGTEAAAVTVIEYEATSIEPWYEFHANRPFIYIISEQSTGTIFFMGQFTGLEQTNSMVSSVGEKKEGAFIYDLSGRRIDSSFFTPHSSLKKGIYIQNGHKMMK
ncbi:MAG: serpin family protein [Bacteroidaceae bacterium]|nr:serpin family protein [Bacteroidaceae bacterium]